MEINIFRLLVFFSFSADSKVKGLYILYVFLEKEKE